MAEKKKKAGDLSPAVIYARFSSSGQREESITGQIRDCTAWAERNGFEILRTYEDRARTGTNDRRPAFQQMIRDAKSGSFSAISGITLPSTALPCLLSMLDLPEDQVPVLIWLDDLDHPGSGCRKPFNLLFIRHAVPHNRPCLFCASGNSFRCPGEHEMIQM